jgi:hypothetical protein
MEQKCYAQRKTQTLMSASGGKPDIAQAVAGGKPDIAQAVVNVRL